MIQPVEKHRTVPEKLMTGNRHRKLFECFDIESKWMELLTSMKLILRLQNIRLYDPSWDPPLLLCKSEFLLADLMNLDTISILAERLIFKVNAGFLGPQIPLTTMILRFLINNLGFMFMHLTLFTSNPLYPLLLYNRGAGARNEVCGRGLLNYGILSLKILATIFLFFTIMQLL